MPNAKNTTEGFIRVVLPKTTSTMADARRLAAIHACGAVRAVYQSAGRGRLPGRSWSSEPGLGLSCTVWMPAARFALTAGRGEAPPPLAAGLALRRALLRWAACEGRSFPSGISLKWPNDLLCGDKKLAGILCEAAGDALLMGFGANLAQRSFGPGYATAPSSVALETGAAPDSDALVDMLLDELAGPAAGSLPWLAELDGALAWKGRVVDFSPGLGSESPIRGVLRGVGASGALKLLVDGSELSFVSGELKLGSY